VSARIISVDTKEEATALISRLQAGESFAALAKAYSKDETAQNGGDLGFVRLEMMQTGIGAVMFSLGVGQTTVYPVKNGLRWYIIRVDAHRQRPPPSFDEVRAILARDVTEAGVAEVRQQILKAVKIRFYGMAGKPAQDQAQ
jgi:peptidyl-prolyl cis-trans isomerase C